MNIFYLDTDIQNCAEALCDKHLVKMILETAQLLCSPFNPGVAPYKRTHYNHPCAKWTRECVENYTWLINYGEALCKEYEFRYGKTHKCQSIITWCNKNLHILNLNINGSITERPQAMPDIYKDKDPVVAYRNYYKNEKKSIAKWNNKRTPPIWF